MPTYEYACKSCGQHLEVVQSFLDDALTECPACGGTLRKVFGNIGITFKGSGFYRTDNRSDGHKSKVSSSETRNGASAGGTKATKGEGAGPATKSEPSASNGSASTVSSGASTSVAAAS